MEEEGKIFLRLLPSIPPPSTCHAEGTSTNWGGCAILPGCLPTNVNHWLRLLSTGQLWSSVTAEV